MRKILSCCIAVFAILLISSCEKDEVKVVMQNGIAPALTASQSTLILSAATGADTVETFTWSPVDYGFSAAVKYSIQVAKAGTSFAAPKEVSVGSNQVFKYTGAELNQLALILGLPHSNVGKLDVRVKAVLTDSIPALYSNVSTVTITPYQVIINYPSLWVPGDYQGWDPASAPKISSKADNGLYEGFVNFPGPGGLIFKFTSHPDWTHTSYGWASSTVSGNNVTGTFNTTGGNLFVPTPGYYLLKANTTNNTWSAEKMTFSLIGNAPTLSNNWTNDVPMTYDAVNKVWTVTTTFAVGGFKIRANGAWALNFGDTGADLSLEYNGADIAIKTAGTYTVKMDLKPGNYTYTIQ